MEFDQEFVRVKHKKGKRFKNRRFENRDLNKCFDDGEPVLQESEIIEIATKLKMKLLSSRESFKETEFFIDVKKSIEKCLEKISEDGLTSEWPLVLEVLGLGDFDSSHIAKQQLELVLALRLELNLSDEFCLCYDPVFTAIEVNTLKQLGMTVPDMNDEGKRQNEKCRSIYFLPHCDKILYNNLLWRNWGTDLSHIIIIGNSFTSMVERTPKRLLQQHGNYILRIAQYTEEVAFPNTYTEKDVFNDTSIHTFPADRLKLLPEDFWTNNPEPVYTDDASDFISGKIGSLNLA